MSDIHDFSHVAIADDQGPRFKWLYLTNVEVAVTICVPVFMFAALLGQSLDFKNLLIALVSSGIVLALLASWSSLIGVKTRLSTALLVKRSFGEQGAKAVWLVLALSLFGWFGVQTELFVKAFMFLLHEINPDWHLNKIFVTIISGLLMSSTAILGIKGVGKLAQLSIPLLLGVMIYAVYTAIAQKGLSPWFAYEPENPMAIGVAIAAIIGGYSVGVIVMPDVKRFALNGFHSVTSAVVSLGIFYPLLLGLVALTAVLMQQPDFMVLLLGFGLGSVTLFILMLATWTTNDVNLYSASLSLSLIFPKIARSRLTFISGLIGTIVACFGIFENIIPLFMLFGIMTTPLLVIYSLDFLQGKFRDYATNPDINWTAIMCWVLSSLIGVLTTPADQWGLGVFELTTVPVLDSFMAALVICTVVRILSHVKKATFVIAD